MLRLEVRIHPIDELLVVEDDVPRLQHPVPLAGKVEELRGDPPPLERREHLESLPYRHAEVVLVVDDHARLSS